MFTKATVFTALFVFLGFLLQFADATPPACVLACVNEHEVSDMKAICEEEVDTMTSCLKKACDAAVLEDAIASYKSSCKEDGIDVDIPTSTSAAATSTEASTTTATSTPTISQSANANNTNPDGDNDKEDEGNASSRVYYNSMLALIAVFAAAVAL
ncbi:hypothetical protein BDZ91DRAFT_759038 [Kalaharituber pfeilii]|nr:hypothetical protein BDZ91DRAFT_759038 [Kalaharituber pfeilii]